MVLSVLLLLSYTHEVIRESPGLSTCERLAVQEAICGARAGAEGLKRGSG